MTYHHGSSLIVQHDDDDDDDDGEFSPLFRLLDYQSVSRSAARILSVLAVEAALSLSIVQRL
jgi:hypothetical protein